MHKIYQYTTLLSIILLMTSCAPKTLQLNQEFQLNINEKTSVDNLELIIDTITDSRCPKDVRCISAGTATISGYYNQQSFAITTLPNRADGPQKTAKLNAYTIELIDISPYPEHAEEKYTPEQYTITMKITKE